MGDDLSISKSTQSPHRQVRKVRKIVAHQYYDPKKLSNDIAMIFVCICEEILIAFCGGRFLQNFHFLPTHYFLNVAENWILKINSK